MESRPDMSASRMEERKLLPPAYLLMAIALMLVTHFAIPIARVVSGPWNLVGIAPLVGGILINVVADQAFKAAGTTVKPFEESSALVTSGVYRISRHPMYLGIVLIVLGVALLLGSLLSFFIAAALAVLLDRRFIAGEEAMLAARFGEDWQAYKRRARRWV